MSIWNKTKANYERNFRIDAETAAAQLAELTERIEREREAREIAEVIEWVGQDDADDWRENQPTYSAYICGAAIPEKYRHAPIFGNFAG